MLVITNCKYMIERKASIALRELSLQFGIIALTGPRRAGKSSLVRALFNHKPYISLDDPDAWSQAESDPAGFLARFPDGAVIDGMDRGLRLLSPLRDAIERRCTAGRYILSGGQSLDLALQATENLGGTAGLLRLLPLAAEEMWHSAPAGMGRTDLNTTLLTGGYPEMVAGKAKPMEWFPAYINDFLERELRDTLPVRDLIVFHRFMKLCATRTGHLLNLSAIALDCDISHVTAAKWFSVLEDCQLVFRLPPYPQGFGKRVVKTSKLYFLDTGLAAWLMGIRDTGMLDIHPQRSMLFETWCVTEFVKARYNAGTPALLFFWRDNIGNEVDLLYEVDGKLQPIEIKASATPVEEWFQAARRWKAYAGEIALPHWFIYGGGKTRLTGNESLVAWTDISQIV